MPKPMIFLTIPAAVLTYLSYTLEGELLKISLIKYALVLSVIGYITTLLTVIGRFNPFPTEIMLFRSPEFLMGLATLMILYFLKRNFTIVASFNEEKTNNAFDSLWKFFLVFSLYTALWASVSHELLASFNIAHESTSIRGVRSFGLTIWWTIPSSWMIFQGVRSSAKDNEENVGFGLLSVTIFKVLFIDLHSTNTNLKAFIFMTIGALMLAISYMANRKSASPSDGDRSTK